MIEESETISVNQKENLAFAMRFFLTLAFSILNGYFFTWINSYFNFKVDQEDIQELKLKDKIMVILLIAPIVETFVFQYIPIQIVMYYTKNKWLVWVSLPLFLLVCTFIILFIWSWHLWEVSF